MTAEWGGSGTGGNAPDPGPTNRLNVSDGSSWPKRIGGYAKLLWAAFTTLGTTGVIACLQSAGVTHLPPWVSACLTAVIGIGTVLLSPKNKP